MTSSATWEDEAEIELEVRKDRRTQGVGSTKEAVTSVGSSIEGEDLDGLTLGVDDPVLGYAGGQVRVTLDAQIAAGGPRRQDFDDQVGSSVDALDTDAIGMGSQHDDEIRLENGLVRELDPDRRVEKLPGSSIAKVTQELVLEIARDALVLDAWWWSHEQLSLDELVQATIVGEPEPVRVGHPVDARQRDGHGSRIAPPSASGAPHPAAYRHRPLGIAIEDPRAPRPASLGPESCALSAPESYLGGSVERDHPNVVGRRDGASRFEPRLECIEVDGALNGIGPRRQRIESIASTGEEPIDGDPDDVACL